jgi:hypothetical protein
MSNTPADTDYLDQTVLDDSIMALLGFINYSWAQLDLISSGAFAGLLKLDPVELGITIGRIETHVKIAKMQSIARHRRDKKMAGSLSKVKKDLTRLRPTRNAVTHGTYIGKSGQGELCFKLPAEFIVEETQDTAHQLFIFTVAELKQHILDITEVAVTLRREFDSEEMHELFGLPSRVRRSPISLGPMIRRHLGARWRAAISAKRPSAIR